MFHSPRSSLVSYNPYFRVSSWDAASPIMQEMMESTALMPGWENFGWSRAGDRLLWRNSFNDADTMLASFDAMMPLMNRMIAGPATLEQFNFSAPLSALAQIQAQTARDLAKLASQPDFFETDVETGFFRKSTPGRSDSFCTMTPQYKIKDWQTAGPIVQAIINKSNQEQGCSYFSWERSGDTLKSREVFDDGNAMRAHLENVKPLLEQIMSGPATLEKIEMHGPDKELEAIKDIASSLNPEYFVSSTMQIKDHGGAVEASSENV